ncbi:MAG: HAMP domain-containing sensor histidine kinase [Polyangiaceae bacterium]
MAGDETREQYLFLSKGPRSQWGKGKYGGRKQEPAHAGKLPAMTDSVSPTNVGGWSTLGATKLIPMPVSPHTSPTSSRRLLVYAGFGLVGGGLYAALNTVLDLMSARGRDLGLIGTVHGFVDRVIPLLTGVLVGIGGHYWHLRSALAQAEALRAQNLHDRLHRVERDQAVWLVAAATLHEVNNPLHSLGLLLDELAALRPEEESIRAELLISARLNADRVRERLLSLKAAADGARPQSTAIVLDAEVSTVASEMAALANRQGIALSVDANERIVVRGDALFLRIIVENLLRNAIDAVQASGGKVDVRVTRDEEGAAVRVSDDGPGISEDVSRSLFDPLLSPKLHGLGLGLSIARALARSMGGDLVLAKHPGWPTSFILKLPQGAT